MKCFSRLQGINFSGKGTKQLIEHPGFEFVALLDKRGNGRRFPGFREHGKEFVPHRSSLKAKDRSDEIAERQFSGAGEILAGRLCEARGIHGLNLMLQKRS